MSDWLEEAKRRREEMARVRDSVAMPEGDAWHRGALIEALKRLGTTSGMFSGEHVEGDEFFARQPTEDLRSLLHDHWFIITMDHKPFDVTPPDVPDVPEPEIKMGCRCNCGYTCGRRCGLPLDECIEAHFERDCEHDFEGWVEFKDEDGRVRGGSTVCKHCGLDSMGHDMVSGP